MQSSESTSVFVWWTEGSSSTREPWEYTLRQAHVFLDAVVKTLALI